MSHGMHHTKPFNQSPARFTQLYPNSLEGECLDYFNVLDS